MRCTRLHLLPCCLLVVSTSAAAQTLFVTTPLDVVDIGGAQTVASLPGPDGVVSMREACLAANNTPGPQTIGFQVPASAWGSSTTGPVILNLGTSFPIDDDETTVDGTTQTAFTGDTNPNGAEVAFHSIVSDPPLVTSGTIAVSSDRNLLLGLGDMTGRNYGIDLLPSAELNHVRGCSITAVFAAVRVQGDDNQIGSVVPGLGNRLSSLADGVRIIGLDGNVAENNAVFGNQLSGGFNGVQIAGAATGNVIGGGQDGAGNHIARAGYFQEDGTPDGAMVRIESDGNAVIRNRIGTDASGTVAADNPGDVGIEIYGDGNIISRNVIGGITGSTGPLAVQAGIHLREGAENNDINGNFIGVDESGTIPIPNHLGILIAAFDDTLPMPGNNLIGSATGFPGNVIANNEAGGIVVRHHSTGNLIFGNELRDNHAAGGLGIDLGGDGPTPDDHGDLDSGPNELMNTPVPHTAVFGAPFTVLTGRLPSTLPVGTLVGVHANPVAAPGELVEAQTLVGTTTISQPDGSFQFAFSPLDTLGLPLTFIASDPAGNSSEISEPIVPTPSPWTDLGSGLRGSDVPLLIGGGPLLPGEDTVLLLHSAPVDSMAFWVIGTTVVNQPAFGGTLVPAPQLIVPFFTGSSSVPKLFGAWPHVPAGTMLVVQAWIREERFTPAGFSASNAVKGVSP